MSYFNMSTERVWLPKRDQWEIITAEYPDEWNEYGEMIERKAPHSSGDNNFSTAKDKRGYIGEKAVDAAIQDWGFQAEFSDLERTDFLKGIRSKAPWDLKWRESEIDVKTAKMPEQLNHVDKWTKFFVSDSQADHPIDYYLFVRVCDKRNKIWICGLISQSKFWDVAIKPSPELLEKLPNKECHYCTVDQLQKEFRPFVFGT